jgi:hypothetical protein
MAYCRAIINIKMYNKIALTMIETVLYSSKLKCIASGFPLALIIHPSGPSTSKPASKKDVASLLHGRLGSATRLGRVETTVLSNEIRMAIATRGLHTRKGRAYDVLSVSGRPTTRRHTIV